MNFKIYNDIHLFAPHVLNVEFDYSSNVILNGDIVDLVNCKKKDVEKAESFITHLVGIYGSRYVSGNHDPHDYMYYKQNGVLFEHGDYIFWGSEKANKFRAKRPGAGWLRRNLGVPLANTVRPKYRELSDLEINRCMDSMHVHTCHTIVLGHKHFDKIIDIKVKEFRIIVLPRGVHEIDID